MKTLLAVVLCTSAAWAERPTLSAGVGFTSELLSSSQYDLVAKDDALRMYRVTGGVVFAVPRGHLDLDLGWRSGASHASAHQTVDADLWVRGIDVTATYRYAWLAHLEPYARVGAGWDFTTLTLLDSARLTQTVGTPMGSAWAGVQVPFSFGPGASPSAQVTLDLGVGGVFRPGARFDALAPQPGGARQDDPVAQGAVSLGTLPMTGLTWRLGLTLRL